MKKLTKILSVCAALVLCAVLAACGSSTSSYTQYALDEVSGVKVEAENGTADQETTTEGGLVVEKNDVVIISPNTEKGSFHLTITPSGSTTPAYDEDVEGRVLFTDALEPGTYNVTTHGNGVTGELVVAAQNGDEFAASDGSLAEALEDAGVDPEVLKTTDSE